MEEFALEGVGLEFTDIQSLQVVSCYTQEVPSYRYF